MSKSLILTCGQVKVTSQLQDCESQWEDVGRFGDAAIEDLRGHVFGVTSCCSKAVGVFALKSERRKVAMLTKLFSCYLYLH